MRSASLARTTSRSSGCDEKVSSMLRAALCELALSLSSDCAELDGAQRKTPSTVLPSRLWPQWASATTNGTALRNRSSKVGSSSPGSSESSAAGSRRARRASGIFSGPHRIACRRAWRVERATRIVLRAKKLPAFDDDAGRWANSIDKAGQRRDVDRIGESQHDMIEIGDAVGLFGGAGRIGRRKQRHEARVEALAFDRDAQQRPPGLCGSELQGARAEPLPSAGRVGLIVDSAPDASSGPPFAGPTSRSKNSVTGSNCARTVQARPWPHRRGGG